MESWLRVCRNQANLCCIPVQSKLQNCKKMVWKLAQSLPKSGRIFAVSPSNPNFKTVRKWCGNWLTVCPNQENLCCIPFQPRLQNCKKVVWKLVQSLPKSGKSLLYPFQPKLQNCKKVVWKLAHSLPKSGKSLL
jgi:hypothetical protein